MSCCNFSFFVEIMKWILSFFCILMLPLCLWAKDNTVLLTINGKPVMLTDFLYHYNQFTNKADKPAPTAYLRSYVLFKLKVEDALEQKMNQLPTFKAQWQQLEQAAVKEATPSVVFTGNYDDRSMYQYELYTVYLPQHPDTRQSDEALRLIRTFAQSVKEGKSFKEIALHSASGLKLEYHHSQRWESSVELLDEIGAQLHRLGKGETSAVFDSPLGWHVLRLLDRSSVDTVQAEPIPTVQPLSDVERNALYEGLLVANWEQTYHTEVGQSITEEALSRYFKEHRKEYGWEMPRFKGGIVACPDKKARKKIKKKLKNTPLEQWDAVLTQMGDENPELRSTWVKGLFGIGKNAWVDYVVFKCGEEPEELKQKVVLKVGKKLKKGPEEYSDVRAQVERDYRTYLNEAQLLSLKRKYKVEINEDIIKTVNYNGYK